MTQWQVSANFYQKPRQSPLFQHSFCLSHWKKHARQIFEKHILAEQKTYFEKLDIEKMNSGKKWFFLIWNRSDLTFTCTKSTTETLQKGVKYVQS